MPVRLVYSKPPNCSPAPRRRFARRPTGKNGTPWSNEFRSVTNACTRSRRSTTPLHAPTFGTTSNRRPTNPNRLSSERLSLRALRPHRRGTGILVSVTTRVAPPLGRPQQPPDDAGRLRDIGHQVSERLRSGAGSRVVNAVDARGRRRRRAGRSAIARESQPEGRMPSIMEGARISAPTWGFLPGSTAAAPRRSCRSSRNSAAP